MLYKMIENEINIFSFYWTTDRDIIRIYGMTQKGDTICLNVKKFKRWIYIKLDEKKEWDYSRLMTLKSKLKQITGVFNFECCVEHKQELYYASKTKTAPYLKIVFEKMSSAYYFKSKLRMAKTSNSFVLDGETYFVHEDNASEILQFTSIYNLPTSGWIRALAVESEQKYTICEGEYDVILSDKVVKIARDETNRPPPTPNVISYDVECFSSVAGAFPNAELAADAVFQISAVTNDKKYLFTMINPAADRFEIPGISIFFFKTEAALLIDFGKFVKNSGAHILMGYNILGFDIKYLMERARFNNCFTEFCNQQYKNTTKVNEKEMKWSSSAYGANEFKYFEIEGRLIIDVLQIVKRTYKFSNYKLDTVAHEILRARKDPVKPKDIFLSYKEGVLGTDVERLALVGKYCVKDSELVLELFNEMLVWFESTEMATIMNVPIEYLYLRGQQIRTYSQIYKHCVENNTIVQRNAYSSESDTYKGATVFDMKSGLYQNVITLDFAALYPSIIIAFNLCYSTYIKKEDWDKYARAEYNSFVWEEHSNCQHDPERQPASKKKVVVVCAQFEHRFLKEPKGIIPTILENLLSKRKEIRGQMKGTKDELLISLLDKRQLAYKLSSNSTYGMFGVSANGMLPLVPVAMVVTHIGRTMVARAASEIQQKFSGCVIYGDTDSNFCIFPQCKTTQELWDYCLHVEKNINSAFPPPIRLEFENKIYKKILMLTKKKYITLSCDRAGNLIGNDIDKAIHGKGSVLVRRDFTILTKQLYKTIVRDIFNEKTLDQIIEKIYTFLHLIFRRMIPLNAFIISRSLKKDTEYKCAPLPVDEKQKQEILQKRRLTEEQYYQKLPAHVQLARRMKARGREFAAGSRIEYVITTVFNTNEVKYKKIEELEYFKRHRDILRIDYLCYVNQLVNPVDDLLKTSFNARGAMNKIYKRFFQKYKVVEELKQVFKVEIIEDASRLR